MTTRILVLSAAALAVVCSSCRPIGGPPPKEKPAVKQLTPEEEAKKKEEERLKAEEELKKKQEAEAQNNPGNLPPTPPTPPTNTARPDYPFANKVPGKDGFVFSPYNNKVIEVRDDQGRIIASGTLVADPTYPPSEKKYFRVP